MAIKYTEKEIKIFRRKDMRSLIQTLINADGHRNEGSGKTLNRKEIKDDLLWVIDLENEAVDIELKKGNEEEKKEIEKMTSEPPF